MNLNSLQSNLLACQFLSTGYSMYTMMTLFSLNTGGTSHIYLEKNYFLDLANPTLLEETPIE